MPKKRRGSSTSRAPDSVLAFAAASAGFPRPLTGTPTPAPSCCRCPHHCIYKAYKAAITDPNSSRADLTRLPGDLKEERKADRERARYYRMQDEEAAIMAVAAAGGYDSDD